MGLEAYITLGFLIKKRAVVFCLVTKLCLTLLQPDGLSMGLPRQEYWSGIPFPSPGDLPDTGIKLAAPALAGRFSPTEPPGRPDVWINLVDKGHSALLVFSVI